MVEQEATQVKAQEPRKMNGQDQAVMQTANDALVTKVYAESLGYFSDPFVSAFLPKKRKMLPIINRGTWSRVHAVRQIILRFLAMHKDQKVNIVSLGCGYDSTYFWLKKTCPDFACIDNYVEIDFQDVVQSKSKIIQSHEEMLALLGSDPSFKSEKDLACINSETYKLFYSDVRDGELIKQDLTEMKVDGSLPTLVLTECLLIYMKGIESQQVLDWVKTYFSGDLGLVNYEMINPQDRFGQMMVENLENRGCQLLGIHECPSIESQKTRMNNLLKTETNSVNVECLSMTQLYREKLNAEGEKTRIEKIELFDEFEEWDLLQNHYCLCLATRAENNESPINSLAI